MFFVTAPKSLFFESTEDNLCFDNLIEEIVLTGAYPRVVSHTPEPTSHESEQGVLFNQLSQVSLSIIILDHFTLLQLIYHMSTHVFRISITHVL